MNIYSIKNEKIGFFNRPMYFESYNECLSYLQNVLMSDADRALIGLKDDLALYFLGTIDFVSGVIDARKGFPHKLVDLKEIFETVPADRIPRDSVQLNKKIDDLYKIVDSIKKGCTDDNT